MAENKDVDAHFYERADAVIALANAQCRELERGQVSASTLFGAARFNAWVAACGHASAAGLQADKAEVIEYFVAQYRAMLESHLEDYVANFANYMQSSKD